MTEHAKKLLLLYHEQSKKNRTIQGSPPITFKGKGKDLKNYRIYGNTVNGESVGDRTGNLFDLNTWANTIRNINGNGLMSISGNTISITSVNSTDCFTMPYVDSQIGVYKIPVKPNTIYTVNWYGSKYRILLFKNGTLDRIYTYDTSDDLRSFTTDSDATFITIRFGVKPTNPVGTTATISDFMISEGSTALPYEPYGYKIHVTLTADSTETTDIYLDEPLAKSGNNTDYIDYATQKRHNSDGTESSVTLPEISTLAGTNTLSVGTEVQPSEVEINGRIKAVQEGGGQNES